MCEIRLEAALDHTVSSQQCLEDINHFFADLAHMDQERALFNGLPHITHTAKDPAGLADPRDYLKNRYPVFHDDLPH